MAWNLPNIRKREEVRVNQDTLAGDCQRTGGERGKGQGTGQGGEGAARQTGAWSAPGPRGR